MREEWYRYVKLGITWDEFQQLPRNPAFKYEYFDKHAWLTPRPKSYRALLPLAPGEPTLEVDAQWEVVIRQLEEADWEDLVGAFASAFYRVVPFSNMDDDERKDAARQCLEKTRNGGDGPLIVPACFVAALAEDRSDTVGAMLVTLGPGGDPTDWDANRWPEAPPPDAIARRLGRPHLTWIFVAPLLAGYGIGTALLSNAAPRLVDLGYRELASTFLLGNESSTMWHWRNGFQLLEYPGSLRRMRREIRASRPSS